MSTDNLLYVLLLLLLCSAAINDCLCVVCYTDSKGMTSLISEPVDKECPVTTNPAGKLN